MSYCNDGFGLLSEIVRRVGGENSFAEYVKKQLVDKYGVRSSQVTTKTVGTDVQPYKGEPVWNCVALIRLVK